MKQISLRSVYCAVPAAIVLSYALSTGCGGSDFTFGGDNNNNPAKVVVTGNFHTVTPVTTRDIVVFVYNIPNNDTSDRCPCPPNPCPNSPCTYVGKAAVVSSGTTKFTVSDIEPGKLGIVFLLDNAGTNADGEIDPGDPIAVLDDPDCELDDVSGKLTVTLTDVDISFQDSDLPVADCSQGTPPAAGRARADHITMAPTTTGSGS